MAEISHTRTATQNTRAFVATWSPLAQGDTGEPVGFSQYSDKSVQVAGAFGGASVRIDLPTADPVRLKTGTLRQAELQGQWLSAPWGLGWRTSLGLRWRAERIGAGDVATLWRQGVAVGGALQPRHELRGVGLEAGVLRSF